MASTPREHIEQIRKETFGIGEKESKIASMLDRAVKLLAAEIYSKDVHFFMELIQNAEDNEYLDGVDPSLEFVITSRDITCTGAPATLLMFNNERGFSPKNIESLCDIGNSTKKGKRKSGYIGEKGIGFKSVFLITSKPHIFSNGYQICFNEKPCPDCKLGFIVPEWVDENPSISDIKQVYGSCSDLPTTILVLPLKPDKVKPVKQQLSSIHPEVLLFLAKIKRLSVREHNENPEMNSVSAIAITKEANFVTRKNIDAESFTLHLSAQENADQSDKECSYYMWKQRFPVRQENKVERRMDVDDYVITLAFPNGDRLNRGMNSPGIYAFLPTEMVTNFPFIIQADFLLQSSRETILLDDVWNEGILKCVPSAFVNALSSLVKTTEDAPLSSLPRMFQFLPISECPSYFNPVRDSIKKMLAEEDIIPRESYIEQKFFHKPCEIFRVLPAFWYILKKARKQGVSLRNLNSHGCFVLNSSFDRPGYDNILNFLGVGKVQNEWYARCIQGSDLVTGVSDETYLELLFFLAHNWHSFQSSSMGDVPLIKYVSLDGSVSLSSINESAKIYREKVLCQALPSHVSWLINWNKEFQCVANHFFLPKSTQEALHCFPRKETVLEWLRNQVQVTELSVCQYATLLLSHFKNDRKLAIAYVHFLYHSFSKDYLSEKELNSLRSKMPLVDSYGHVTSRKNGILVPANGSKWVELIGSNPWREEGYVELGEDYLRRGHFAGTITESKQLIEFLKTHISASDIPYMSPPNAGIPTVSGPLTKENAFLLLEWIRHLRYLRIPIPEKFLTCIKKGSWLKVLMNGSAGYRPPSQSFLLSLKKGTSNWGAILQNSCVFVDIPLIDESFYGAEILSYKEELRKIGVMFEYGEACEFIGKHLVSRAAFSSWNRNDLISILNFIRFLRQNYLSPDEFICSLKEGQLRTSRGPRSLVGSVLDDQEWRIAKQISDLPFVDLGYYGHEVLCFKPEIQLLGIIVGFNANYKLVADYLKSSSDLSYLTSEAFLLTLECMRHSRSSDKFVKELKSVKCLKTSVGYKSPGECFLLDPEWGCLLQVFHGFPVIDDNFYGNSITSWKKELQQLGVKTDFEEAVMAFVGTFKQKASSSSITKEHVLAFLSCFRQIKGTSHKFPNVLKTCIREEKWLRTQLGLYKSPSECILFGPEWVPISPITILPFIDDSDKCYGKAIHEYKTELKLMGVVVELKAGVRFVAAGLWFPQDPCRITPVNVLSLLQCLRILLQEKNYVLPESFLRNASCEWLKTSAGYRTPGKCCLFDTNWKHVKHTDGPFIDEAYYGSDIASYKNELGAIGITIDVRRVCSLLVDHLGFLSEFAAIVRVYRFLNESNWKLESNAAGKIWIPHELGNGRWVSPKECVLHDRKGLFGLQLNVLEKHYEPNLLYFFSSAFDVKSNPSLDDCCKLWKFWERSELGLSHARCCAFWEFVITHWCPDTERTLAADLLKIPVASGSDPIVLSDKRDVFIADDLLLNDLFEQSSQQPIFVWHPQPSLASLPYAKLLEVYRKIGVRAISETVEKEEVSLADGGELKQIRAGDSLIGRELVRLILGYLAEPSSLNLEAKKRHEAVQCLTNLSVMETQEPINVSYNLSLSSGKVLNVKASRMIRWDRKSSQLFTQKLGKDAGHKIRMEYATYFSQVIAEGVLWDKVDHVSALAELIRVAFLVDFNEDAIQFLMRSKNLQVFQEDEEFLSAAFASK